MRYAVHLGGLVLGTVILALALAQPAQAQCRAISVTADGFSKESAVQRSQAALKSAIGDWARENNRSVRSVSAYEAPPQPYWRETVTEDLFLRPDVRTREVHTICWRGVISAAVCTSASRVC